MSKISMFRLFCPKFLPKSEFLNFISRYYYDKGIMQKIVGERYVYKFLTLDDYQEPENDDLKIIKLEQEPEILNVQTLS